VRATQARPDPVRFDARACGEVAHGLVRILPCVQEEMMVREDSTRLEKMMTWREEKKQIKID